VSLVIDGADVAAAESQQLLAELWKELDELYGNEVATAIDPRGAPTGIKFVVARENGVAVGCGAIRPRSAAIAEVKRVFVRQTSRGTGVARAIMCKLEQLACAAGFNEIWLETGLRQPAAIRLYESLGYTRIADFGDYKDDPLSVCYGKTLMERPAMRRE
jgi:GNAT superfamily N-acetyltransferase